MSVDEEIWATCLDAGHPILSDGFCPCGAEYDPFQDQGHVDNWAGLERAERPEEPTS